MSALSLSAAAPEHVRTPTENTAGGGDDGGFSARLFCLVEHGMVSRVWWLVVLGASRIPWREASPSAGSVFGAGSCVWRGSVCAFTLASGAPGCGRCGQPVAELPPGAGLRELSAMLPPASRAVILVCVFT